MTEERIRNERTGGEKGQKLARFDLVPPRALFVLAEHYGQGAKKYADRNWEKGVDWSLNFAALQRHMWEWWSGFDNDEDGNSHLAAAMWHMAALIEYAHTHPELDDRPNSDEACAKARYIELSDEKPRIWRTLDLGPQDTVEVSPPTIYGYSWDAWEDKFDEDFLAYLDWKDGYGNWGSDG